MRYITIDFETANQNLDSACSIGMVIVDDDKVDIRKYLINPNQPFAYSNTLIHGITYEDVKDYPTFKEVWEKIKNEFTNSIVYAHNAPFDMSVLKACINRFNLELPSFKYGCTLQIARRLWKDELVNFRLSTISNFLELKHNHHNALSDALVCVEIINRGMRVMQVDDDQALYKQLGLKHKVL